MNKFKLSTGPRTAEQIGAAADQLEKEIGEIANGERKASKVDMKPIATLVQWARDSMGEIDRLNWLIKACACDELAEEHPEFVGIPFGQSELEYLTDIRERINRAIARRDK